MPDRLKIVFSGPAVPATARWSCSSRMISLWPLERGILWGRQSAKCCLGRSRPSSFRGKPGSVVSLVAPSGLQADRLVVVGIGAAKDRAEQNFVNLGGTVAGRVGPEGCHRAPRRAVRLASGRAGDRRFRDGLFAAQLPLRSLQDEEGRFRRARRPRDADARARGPRGRQEGLEGAKRYRGRRGAGAGPRQRAAERALSRRSSPAAPRIWKSSASRSRCSTRTRCDKIGMRALLGVGQGSRARSQRRRHALERRAAQGRQGQAASPSSARGLLRFRRHLDQARRRHGGHEGRHGGRRLRRRPHARARRAARPRSTPSASSGWSRTCRTATPSVPATSSRACPARRSRSSTPTPRAAWCWPTCSGTCRSSTSRPS